MKNTLTHFSPQGKTPSLNHHKPIKQETKPTNSFCDNNFSHLFSPEYSGPNSFWICGKGQFKVHSQRFRNQIRMDTIRFHAGTGNSMEPLWKLSNLWACISFWPRPKAFWDKLEVPTNQILGFFSSETRNNKNKICSLTCGGLYWEFIGIQPRRKSWHLAKTCLT